MISVFVREVQEVDGHKLGEFYPGDLPALVARFKEYPIYSDNLDSVRFSDARFVCDGGSAYFEILVEVD